MTVMGLTAPNPNDPRLQELLRKARSGLQDAASSTPGGPGWATTQGPGDGMAPAAPTTGFRPLTPAQKYGGAAPTPAGPVQAPGGNTPTPPSGVAPAPTTPYGTATPGTAMPFMPGTQPILLGPTGGGAGGLPPMEGNPQGGTRQGTPGSPGGPGAMPPVAGDPMVNPDPRMGPGGPPMDPRTAAGPGVDEYGLPTAGQAGEVNQGVLDLLRQLMGNAGPGGSMEDLLARAQGVLGGVQPGIDRAIATARGEFDPVPAGDASAWNFLKSGGGGGGTIPNVDRVQLAQQALERFRESRRPQFEQDLRSVGQKAAAFGRTGAGMTTNDLTGLSQGREAELRRFEEGVLDQALGDSVEDEFRRAQLAQADRGLSMQGASQYAGLAQRAREFASGQEMTGAGMLPGLAGSMYGLGQSHQGTIGDAISRGQGVSDQLFGQDQSIRGERRGLARDAISDNINEILLENQLSGDAFQRAMQQAQMLMQTGQMDSGAWNDLFGAYMG